MDITGYFTESGVINYTPSEIVIIKRTGERERIPPNKQMSHNQTLRLFHREFVGERKSVQNVESFVTAAPLFEIEITWFNLQAAHYIYVKELDVVVTYPAYELNVSHPRKWITFGEALALVCNNFIEDNLLTFKFMANDSRENPVETVYFEVKGKVVPVAVAHEPDGGMGLYVVAHHHNKKIFMDFYPFEQMEKEMHQAYRTESPCGAYVGLSEDGIRAAMDQDLKFERTAIPIEEQQIRERELVSKLTLERDEAVDFALRQGRVEVDRISLLFKEQQNKTTAMTTQLSECQSQLQAWKGASSARVEMLKVGATEYEEVHKTKRAAIATRTEEVKYDGLWLKTMGALAVVVVTWIVASHSSKK